MQMIIFSIVAGILGMGVGGLLSAILIKKASDHIVCWLLSFSAGLMISIVCFGLLPEAIELSGGFITVIGLVAGIIIIMALNKLVDKATGTGGENMAVHHTHEALYHQQDIISSQSKMLRSGIIMLIAISLHNIPEGIAIGAGGSHDVSLGTLITLMVLLHNVPEGMALAAPLLAGGMNRWKAALWTAAAGAPTVLGSVLGVLIGNISSTAIALSIAIAGGAMLYVVFVEIMPQSIIMTKSKLAPIIMLFGLIVGLLVSGM